MRQKQKGEEREGKKGVPVTCEEHLFRPARTTIQLNAQARARHTHRNKNKTHKRERKREGGNMVAVVARNTHPCQQH